MNPFLDSVLGNIVRTLVYICEDVIMEIGEKVDTMFQGRKKEENVNEARK